YNQKKQNKMSFSFTHTPQTVSAARYKTVPPKAYMLAFFRSRSTFLRLSTEENVIGQPFPAVSRFLFIAHKLRFSAPDIFIDTCRNIC
ncbi:MAG: hypothetical protein PUB94_06040, partial [Oscillospiraceae bacterium]|nr:hypothetical protein [Oscillospiraceae bacterium]